MFKIFTKEIDINNVINYLEEKLQSPKEQCSWYLKEIATNESQPLFTIHLTTLSRYFNLNLDITKLDIEANGKVSTSHNFTLNEALDLMLNVRQHFNPTLDSDNYTICFEALNAQNEQKYYAAHSQHFSQNFTKQVVSNSQIENSSTKLKLH